MAIAANNRSYATTASADPATRAYTVGAGASLLIAKMTGEFLETFGWTTVRWGATGAGASGELMTAASILYGDITTTWRLSQIFYLINPTARAPGEIWVDLTQTTEIGIEAIWYTGTDATTPIADEDGGEVGSTSIQCANALVPIGNDNFLETCLCSGNNLLTYTPTGSATESNDIDAVDHRSCHSWQSGISANVQPGWTQDTTTTATLSMAAILLKPAAEKRPSPVWRSQSMVPRHLLEA